MIVVALMLAVPAWADSRMESFGSAMLDRIDATVIACP